LKVSGGGGFFSAQITDNSPSFRGKENFLEVSEDKAFTSPHVIHLGASQSWYGNLGAKTLHFRSYSQYPTSAPGAPIYAYSVNGANGSAPAVKGNGSASGWGTQPYTTDAVPIR
jgi:membrane associated rhomboid family serine protease